MIPYEFSSQSPSYQAMVYPNSPSPLIPNMVSERYRLPPRWRNLPPLFPVIFDPISYLMIHSILRHLLKLTKMEKRFSPLPPPRRPIAEFSLGFASNSSATCFHFSASDSNSDGEEELDDEANLNAPVQNSYCHYQDRIHRVNHDIVFARKRKLSCKRSSFFKNLKLENYILFDQRVKDEEEATTAMKILEFETPKKERCELVFGKFGNSNINVISSPSITPIKPKIEGSAFKIGEITCFFKAFNPEDDFGSDSSHPDQELETKEQENAAPLKSQVKVKEEKLNHEIHSEITVLENRYYVVISLMVDRIINGTKFIDLKLNNTFVFITPNLISSCSKLVNSDSTRKALESCSNYYSGVVLSDLHVIDTAIFDPGGAVIEIYISAIIFSYLSNCISISFPRVDNFIFDPGGDGHYSLLDGDGFSAICGRFDPSEEDETVCSFSDFFDEIVLLQPLWFVAAAIAVTVTVSHGCSLLLPLLCVSIASGLFWKCKGQGKIAAGVLRFWTIPFGLQMC